MSKVSFLKAEYRLESAKKVKKCGLVDGENDSPAYSTIDESLKWNATVDNPHEREFQFVPVDYNIIIYKSNSVEKESTCDGMLLVNEIGMLAFVELKNQNTGGFSRAIGQLENTIDLFLKNHQYDTFKIRRAYAANISHPHFHYNMKDEMERFRAKKFVFYPQATISIK